jgi:hypothetical protein
LAAEEASPPAGNRTWIFERAATASTSGLTGAQPDQIISPQGFGQQTEAADALSGQLRNMEAAMQRLLEGFAGPLGGLAESQTSVILFSCIVAAAAGLVAGEIARRHLAQVQAEFGEAADGEDGLPGRRTSPVALG